MTQLRQNAQFVDVDGSDVAIAVLDSGIFAANTDLQSNVIGFYNAVADPVSTTFSSASVNAAFDLEGHGSHTAGIAASSNPDIGVAYAADIVSVKVLASPGEKQLGGSPVVRGLQWVKLHAAELNIRVVNMSIGTATNINLVGSAQQRSEINRLIDSLEEVGVTVVASSGNSYAQYVQPGATSIAAASTISVANTWASTGRRENFNKGSGASGDRYLAIEASATPDRIAASSQRSTLANQVAAPGQDIYSTWNGFNGDGSNGLHKIQSGTSMAAPFVSGLVALMQDAAFTFGGQYFSNPADILQIITDTSDVVRDVDVPDNNRLDTTTGQLLPLSETDLFFKRVNAARAIQKVYEIVTAGNPAPGQPGDLTDLDAVRGRATIVPQLNATQSFKYSGNIGRDGQLQIGTGDIDLFRVSLQTRGNLKVSLSLPAEAPAFDGTIRLFNTAGTEIARADGNATAYPTLETDPFDPLNTGSYYIGISSQNNTAYNIVSGGGVTTGLTAGDYNLDVSLINPDPNGVTQGAVDVDLANPDEAITDPVSGARKITVTRQREVLGSDVASLGSTTRVPVDADVDIYRVVAPDNGSLEIDIDAAGIYGSQAADTYVQVYDETLTKIGQNDDDGDTQDSRLQVSATRGEVYYVAVTVFVNRNFNVADPYASRTPNATPNNRSYDLLMWLDNGDTNGIAPAATEVTLGSTISGVIGSDSGPVGGSSSVSKDVDWFRVVTPQAGLLQFGVAGVNASNPTISLWELDPSGVQITRVDDDALGANADSSIVSLPVSAGRELFVAVSGNGNTDFNWFAVGSGIGGVTGAYTLATELQSSAIFQQLTNGSVDGSTPTVLTLGQSITESIGRDGNVVIGPADVDLYSFTPEADVLVSIRTTASSEEDADTVLRLFDSAGQQISFNDNEVADGKSSRLSASLKKGRTYYIGVNGAGQNALAYDAKTGEGAANGSTGRYGLAIDVLPPGSANLTFTSRSPAVYTDANGKEVTLKLVGGGTGTLQIDGNNPSAFLLTLDDTTSETRLVVKGKTTFGNVQIQGPLKALTATNVTLAGDVIIGGDAGLVSLAAISDFSTLSAVGFQKIVVKQAIAGTAITATTGGIASITAGGVENSTIRASTTIGTLATRSMTDSVVYAGIDSAVTGLPGSSTAFLTSSAIDKLTVNKGPFSNSVIAAGTIRSASIRGLQPDNADVPFGLAANTIESLSVQNGPKWKNGRAPVTVDAIEDFQVRLLAPLS